MCRLSLSSALITLMAAAFLCGVALAAEPRLPRYSTDSLIDRLKAKEKAAIGKRKARRDQRAVERKKDQRSQENHEEERRQAGEESGSR